MQAMSSKEEKRSAERVEDHESDIGLATWQPEADISESIGDQRCRFIGIHNPKTIRCAA